MEASCSICFDDLLVSKSRLEPSAPFPDDCGTNGDSRAVCTTPCGHVFHHSCVAEWIDEHRHCPQCRQRVLSSNRLVTLYFSKEKRSSFHTLPDKDATNDNPSKDESEVIIDVMQCQLDDLENECQKLRKALSYSEEQLETSVNELSAIEAQRDGDFDVAVVNRELESVKAEQEDLQRTAAELREEVDVLNDTLTIKDAEIRQKEAAYEYLLGRNVLLMEETETKSRLVSSLQVKKTCCNLRKTSLNLSVAVTTPRVFEWILRTKGRSSQRVFPCRSTAQTNGLLLELDQMFEKHHYHRDRSRDIYRHFGRVPLEIDLCFDEINFSTTFIFKICVLVAINRGV